MPLQHNELARREAGRVAVRGEPLRVRWTFDDLVSADGHALKVVFSCSVKALGEAAEVRMLEEVFLSGSPSLRAEGVVTHFQNALRAATATLCQGKAGSEWLGNGVNEAMIEALKAAGKRVAFSCGLELLPPFNMELESPTLERQRVEAMQRSLAEQRAAGQVEHFQRASELLKQFQSIQQSAPGLSPGEVLKQLSPADQGTMLQTLLLASSREKRTEAVWAVAGPSLVKVDPSGGGTPKTQVIAAPVELGPLRSVQPAQGGKALLLGARSGVIHVEVASPSGGKCYGDQAVVSQLGFNRAVMWNDEIWASHSEAGIVAWRMDEPNRPMLLLRPVDLLGASPKNLQVLDDSRLIFSTRDRLITLQRDATGEGKVTVKPWPDLRVEVMAVLPEGQRVHVVLKDGTVQSRDAGTMEVLQQERRCGETCSAALLPWLGSRRILIATEDGPVVCVGVDDDLVTQYLSPYRGMKAIAAAADVIAGLSGDRQRLVIWNSWNPRQPVGDVFITAIAKHRAADVDI